MYHFPPFFTKQPNRDTEAKRLQIWMDMILSFCRQYRIFVLEINGATLSSPLFSNTSISRSLSKDEATEVLQAMTLAGLAEWIPGEPNKCIIYWRNPAEWADEIFLWVTTRGHADSVMTMFEFRETSAGSGEIDNIHCLLVFLNLPFQRSGIFMMLY